ncbi:DUF4870 domain-containing protein [Auraticoccus sp. F435]|uniref:DUF4870 domain-containing protein n=1 Tax=Auraticoccus cholistanensis TaxID=2656650 RepID=A0A6A9USZ1_9ACTN|nr:DUF4870 domain-containing protein [Auraticoccus cholistanensis]MVA74792.1 DUF4870 domain-containing protein [Auraticoccus cholistanensis]
MTTSYPPATVRADERTPAVLAHLSAIIAMVVSAGWLSFVGPLLVWLVYRHRSDFVRRSAAGAFNFNLWAWLLSVLGWICAITVIAFPVAVVLWVVAAVMTVVCHVLGAVRASNGVLYTYPKQVRILH